MKNSSVFISLICTWGLMACTQEPALYHSDAFSVYFDRVVQGPYEARAVSSTEIVSNYQHQGNDFMNPTIDFKFAINGDDNEMLSGRDHHFNCFSENGSCETPLIRFGDQLDDQHPIATGTYLKPNTKWKVRLDMRHVFEEFEEKGYYEAFDGRRIMRDDFRGVFIAGGTLPLTWDFEKLGQRHDLMLRDDDGDHIYEIELTLNAHQREDRTPWKLALDIEAYPQLSSPLPLVDALYNMSLEEMIRAIEPDSTLRTGKEWAGVWTRDVSYSIILSMAVLQPKVAQYSLLRKVKDGVIVQDTGTGGAYPVSTDRVIWAVAAWEIFKVTGDVDWLEQVYPIVRKSIEADLSNAYDPATGLIMGESSFLDWREQTYPAWMEPADIYASRCLGTNAVHYQANVVLALMAEKLGDEAVARQHSSVANGIRDGVNKYLWQDDKNYYAQYLYGRTFPMVSPRAEALGEALSVLFDIASPDRQLQVVSNTPMNDFGIPCIHPQIAGVPPYHNDGVWPFVQAYWALAAAKAGNEGVVLESLATIWRPAALFLTNKENFVARTGDYAATQINSDNMLWSLSGNIALVYKILFGIDYGADHLAFHPFIPRALAGRYELLGYQYRDAIIDIVVEGSGNVIKSFTLDENELEKARLPASLKGRHRVHIVLAGNDVGGTANRVRHHVSPPTPAVVLANSALSWRPVRDAKEHKIFRNGTLITTQADTVLNVDEEEFTEYQVVAVDDAGMESFASAPIYAGSTSTIILEAEHHNADIASRHDGFSGSGYIRTNLNEPEKVKFAFYVPGDGRYAVDFRYANGHGSVKTDNKCAIRTLTVDGIARGTVVLPQRGADAWNDWGFSNRLVMDLQQGMSELALEYVPHNANMNGSINEANIDYLRIVRIQ